ncbi:hypothetical protein AC578_221 [Pseudocercospora eumusae]|uniref:Uncharacterized protein n=1 Tax=Pseudocercospora eumusae TaxID=321146 RepID=A0A139HIZ3_9PEZI|nr:hypothetical protein AC578_221 [Pseudocercospora eumusae]
MPKRRVNGRCLLCFTSVFSAVMLPFNTIDIHFFTFVGSRKRLNSMKPQDSLDFETSIHLRARKFLDRYFAFSHFQLDWKCPYCNSCLADSHRDRSAVLGIPWPRNMSIDVESVEYRGRTKISWSIYSWIAIYSPSSVVSMLISQVPQNSGIEGKHQTAWHVGRTRASLVLSTQTGSK